MGWHRDQQIDVAGFVLEDDRASRQPNLASLDRALLRLRPPHRAQLVRQAMVSTEGEANALVDPAMIGGLEHGGGEYNRTTVSEG